MKKIVVYTVIILTITTIIWSGCIDTSINKDQDNQQVRSIEIAIDSLESPIRKYFTTPKILWTFDDYSIQYQHNPPHKGFGGLTERINSYGGNVQIMVIFTSEIYTKTYDNEIRNYSVINDFGYSINDINASLKFFSRPKVEAACHGWNHSENFNDASIDYACKLINFTLWNWKNNYNITPHFFLGCSTSGNYNVTLALKWFSDTYWPVYGENFRWYNQKLFPNGSRNSPAVEYIEQPTYAIEFDPLFGCGWGNPCKNLNEAMELFNSSSAGKELLLIRGHPSFLNGTNQRAIENLSLWEQWIDWIYQTHEVININHTEAIMYNLDRNNYKVIKNDEYNFTIDLTDCNFDHDILFTHPNSSTKNWAIYDKNNEFIGDVQDHSFFRLEHDSIYYFKVK